MQWKADWLSQQNKFILYVIFFAIATGFCASIYHILHDYHQSQFWSFFPWVIVSFSLYFLLFWLGKKCAIPIYLLILVGISTRLINITDFPHLSDDVYRFFWDGYLSAHGTNPYGILPKNALTLYPVEELQKQFSLLNSPDYYTIYPPVAQAIFYIGGETSQIVSFAMIVKCIFIGFECLGLIYVIKILRKIHCPDSHAFLYFLNPLVIIEGTGNLHMEVVMIPLLAAALYYLLCKKNWLFSLFISLSIGTKLLPLMLLPFVLFHSKIQKKYSIMLMIILFSIIIFIPLLNPTILMTLFNSVDLYFRKFEFNASIYYILNYIGNFILGYNPIHIIGPMLGILTICLNLYLAKRLNQTSEKNILTYSLIVWTIYLLCATTVHPWYIIPILFFGIFHDFYFPYVWSFLCMFSYSSYLSPLINLEKTDYLSSNLILIEYVLLGSILFFERKKIMTLISPASHQHNA